MNKVVLNDQADRNKIRNELDQTFLVEAGAGSGKTAGLVDRMVALLAAGKCEPEKLAAVTFTRKAAGELKERFQAGLEKRLREEKDAAKRERLSEALEKIERVFTGTIHSFCSRVLRERPIEAGIAPDFQEVEEGLEEKMLSDLAWEEYVVAIGAGEPQKLDELEELDLSIAVLKEAFRLINNYSDVEIKKVKKSRPDFTQARIALDCFCKQAEKLLPAEEPSGNWDKLQELSRQAISWQEYFDLKDDRYLMRLFNILNCNVGYTQNRWYEQYINQGIEPKKAKERGLAEADQLLAAFEALRDNYIARAITEWHEYRHYHILKFIEPATEYYREYRRRNNVLTFQDLLMLTAELLGDNPGIRKYFRERFTHLLVDEFQDTDPIQAQIMFYMTGLELDEKDWAKTKPKPGSLFVVGDPKQSIYRFRRADIATYNLVKDLIVNSGGEILNLNTNFRSLPSLISWGNQFFNGLFNALPPYQAEFKNMEYVRRKSSGCAEGVFSLSSPKVYRHSPVPIVEDNADKVGDFIEKALSGTFMLSSYDEGEKCEVARKPEPQDFLIITYKKDYLALYARALEKRGIAYSLSSGGGFSDSDELRELVVLLEALADPGNQAALVAVLRGIFFGVSDDQLYRFKKQGGNFSYLSSLPRSLDKDLEEIFTPTWAMLKEFWLQTRKLTSGSAIEKIAGEIGLISYALASEMGVGKASCVLQAVELVRSRESCGVTGFNEAVDYLKLLIEEGVEEEIALDGGSNPAVRIINLHKAKGLEAPVVILAGPAGRKVYDPTLHIDRSKKNAEGYLLITKKKGEYHKEILGLPPDWDNKMSEEEKYRDAEINRLLYVAATRAKDLLVISTYAGKPEISPWFPLEGSIDSFDVVDALEYVDSLEPVHSADEGENGIKEIKAAEDQSKKITEDELIKARDEIAGSFNEIAKPTYSHVSGTNLGEEKLTPVRKQKGKGTEWGTLVHSVLEDLVRMKVSAGASSDCSPATKDLEILAEKVIKHEGQDPAYKEDLVELLANFIESALWQRVCAAEEVLVETPFGFWEGCQYSTGIVDLAFREGGGWVLVDYKSDLIESDAHQKALVQSYRPQVGLYCNGWQKITGAKVKDCGLYFTDNSCYESLIN